MKHKISLSEELNIPISKIERKWLRCFGAIMSIPIAITILLLVNSFEAIYNSIALAKAFWKGEEPVYRKF